VSRTRVQFPAPALTQRNYALPTKLSYVKQMNRRHYGKKSEPASLAYKLASTMFGMMLAMAYVKAKNASLKLRIHKYDGQLSPPAKERDDTRLNVEVTEGLVRKVWVG
jgi:hypothetical protein